VVVSEPTDDSIALTRAALTGLAAIYRPGYGYRKAGVMLSELCAKGTEELVLFVDEEAREKRGRLMSVLDRVNEDWGRGTLGLGTTGLLGARDWSMRRSMKSPSYTTRWDELAVVRAR
jgi:DNA polymerase V